MPATTTRFDPAEALALASRERVLSMSMVGDAFGRPLLDELASGDYDLSGLFILVTGGAALTAPLKERFVELLPQLTILDAGGSSESGAQMVQASSRAQNASGRFAPNPGAVVVSEDMTRVLSPGDDEIGWLAQQALIPLGYLGDADKTARTFPVIDGVRHSVPGDRARWDADGQIELLGRDSVTINSGGEKIFAEEVEAAIAEHPAVYDVVVTGRPSVKWGNEVVAIVQLAEGQRVDAESILAEAARHIARYKLPKDVVFCDRVQRSPSGKADYRWAKAQVAEGL
jgi:3-oxocholest-4-en-26-oate---CoA ligase